MPLLNPGRRPDDEEKPPPSEAQVFVQNAARKGLGFWGHMKNFTSRVSTARMPQGMKQLGHDIWYGTSPKRKMDTRPLKRWTWLWGTTKPKARTLSKPYVAFQGLMGKSRKRKR